ncbi:MAG: phosphotransacetylase family protein [Candidatus Lindowbacteria bacterium]|nr:phosphotransacetylase family protein [Candidatus Lindowbacteria bacterium]
MAFYKESLGLGDALDDLCPVVFTQEFLGEILAGKGIGSYADKTRQAFQRVSANREITIIVGIGYLHSGALIGLSEIEFIKETGGKLLLTDSLQFVNRTVDYLLEAKQGLGEGFAGVLFNRVDPKKKSLIETAVVPYLTARGVEVFGVIPEDPKLAAVTVREILNALSGKLLCCEDNLDEIVERFAIGAMNVDAALRHFVRMRDKAVITGGDRADIMLAALDTSTKCLVLTGNLYPNEVILSRAQQAGVPVIVVPSDTLETVERFEAMMGRLSIRDKNKVEYAVKTMDKHVSYEALFRKIGLR